MIKQRLLTSFIAVLMAVSILSFDVDFPFKVDYDEHDLTRAIDIPFQDPKTQYFEEGSDGFPAFGFHPGSEVKSPYRLFLPERLYEEFSIKIMIKPNSRAGGFIFAVTNPLDTVVQLGVQLSPAGSETNISLLYTDVPKYHNSQIIANFIVSDFVGKWTRLALKVMVDNVTLYYNCIKHDTVFIKKQPSHLIFDSASTLYIAQAGPIIKGAFDGAVQELKLNSRPSQAEVYCDNLEVDQSNPFELDGSGNGQDDIPPFPPPPPNNDEKDCGSNDEECILGEFSIQQEKGLKGEKGEKGAKGSTGDSIRGPPGPPGLQGAPGYLNSSSAAHIGPPGSPGVCSCDVSSLMSTIKASDSNVGAPGAPGLEGKIGPPGISGVPGLPGKQGEMGPKGDKGERGNLGLQGAEGLPGIKGEPGKIGIPGQIGAPGPPGPPGPVEFENFDDSSITTGGVSRFGTAGSKGEPGVPGKDGQPGENGPHGIKGVRGEPGQNGEKGERGQPGEKGSLGLKGEKGTAGTDGIPGISSLNSRPPDKGDKGEPGKPGLAGPPGEVVYISDAKVINDQSRTTYAQGIPGETGSKGEKGDKGDPGINGVPGNDGSPGSTGSKGEHGIPGMQGLHGESGTKGDKGERGLPGPDALSNSENQLITLKGDKGEMGKRGRRGKQGPVGPSGPPGKPGPNGDIGLPGWMGRPGLSGEPGTPGPKGDKGEPTNVNILKGEKGDKGKDGMPGKDGQPGSTSKNIHHDTLPGPPGPPGPPGTPGLPGPPGISLRTTQGESVDLLFGERFFTPKPIERAGTTERDSYTSKIVQGVVTFQNQALMTKLSSISPIGTLAYLVEEESLLVRVKTGWQYIALGSILRDTTPAFQTTQGPQMHPPFEVSNLIHNIPLPVDGPNWYPRMLRMVALNEPHTGDIHGLRGADYNCYRQARQAGVEGTFRAFLTSRVQNIDSIVRSIDQDLPVVNLRGDVLFNSWAGMFKGEGAEYLHSPRIFSFNGKNVLTDLSWPEKYVWHGAHIDGQRALDISCDTWHTSTNKKFGLAGSLQGSRLLEQSRKSCNSQLILLCIEATAEQLINKKKDNIQG